jgi:hypothetical protein
MKRTLLVLSAATLAASTSALAQQSAAQAGTQDLLIQKLTQVHMGLAPSDPARAAVLLRLADLHAERARQLSMKEINEGCSVCKAGDKDRERALTYYSEALTKTPPSSANKIHLQMGRLYELLGQTESAVKSYSSMLSSTNPQEVAEAQLSLAEIAFRKNDFAKAQELYGKVLTTPGASSLGLAAYRKAWCALRLGQVDTGLSGLQEILKNPNLQSRSAAQKNVVDAQFLEEVSRDMATFMAARGVQASDAETLYSLTPEAFKLQQVTILAREATRLGQKEAALNTWNFVYDKHTDPKVRLESQVRMAQLAFDLKKMDIATASFQKSLDLWSLTGCTVADCDESYKGVRQFVVGWNRLETSTPSAGLLSAYNGYFKVFTNDEDMLVWGAQASAQAKQFVQATQWTMQANQLILAKHNSEKVATEQKALADKLEKNLLLGIENAENSKDAALLTQAQDDYLAKSISKSKALDVQYQKAYAVYQKGDYQAAAPMMHDLAMTGTGNVQVLKQAADLSLDALAILKDDARMQTWSKDFAAKFPAHKADFANIEQKSILTQSAKLAEAQPEQSLAALTAFDVKAASAEDRKTYYKNKILLNEKMSRITEARNAVEDLLREPSLTTDEKEFALGRKVWFAELELDFAGALKAAEQMKFSSLTNDEKMLKLALYSELANQDARIYYTQFLKQSQDAEKKALIAMQLVRSSKNPSTELEQLKPHFKSNMGLYARAALEIYGNSGDKKVLEKALKEKGTSKADSFVMIEKILLQGELSDVSTTIAKQTIDPKTQKSLAAGLKERVKMLEKIDGITNRAIATGDWATQILALNLVSKENHRFYNEVLSLPMPAGLTPEQEQEYLMLLSQQVTPNQNMASMADAKLKEFWSQETAKEGYRKFGSQNVEWNQAITQEVEALAAIAPEEQKAAWTQVAGEVKALKTQEQKPSLAELETARTNLKANPFVPSAIEQAIAMEKKAHRRSMVEYLESRLATLAAAPNVTTSKKDSDIKEKN